MNGGRVFGDVGLLQRTRKKGLVTAEELRLHSITIANALEVFNLTTDSDYRVFSGVPAALVALGKAVESANGLAGRTGDAFAFADSPGSSAGLGAAGSVSATVGKSGPQQKPTPEKPELPNPSDAIDSFSFTKDKDGTTAAISTRKNKDGTYTETTVTRDKSGKEISRVDKPKSKLEKDASLSFAEKSGTAWAGVTTDKAGSFSALGATGSYSAQAAAGAGADWKAKVGIDDKHVVAEVKVSASVGVSGSVKAETKIAGVTAKGAATASMSAVAQANGKAKIGLDGVEVEAGASAFAGAKADAEIEGSAGGVKAKAGAGVSAGIGAHATAKGSVSAKKIGVKVDIGATLGLGAEVNFDVSVNPTEVWNNAKKVDLWPF
jgi:hypothetical protein